MPVAAPIQNAVNAGEFSPLVYGRTDYAKYKSGGARVQNMVPLVQGGLTRRVGTKYILPTKNNAKARLKKFVFSAGDAVMLEFGDFTLRFFRNRAPVLVTGAAAYNAGTAYAVSDYVTYGGLQYRSLQAANTGHQPDISPTFWSQQDIYEIASPYSITDVPFLRFLQSKDVMYIAHPSYKPKTLSRFALTNWSFANAVFADGPYLKINDTATTLSSSGTTGSVTVTASSTTNINGGQGFLTTDIGRMIRKKDGTTWGWGIITARTSSTVVTVAIDPLAPFGATTAVAVWRLGEWSDTTFYPSVVFLFEDRLGWAASPVEPTTMNMSKTGDYLNMAPTGTDSLLAADAALQLRLNSKDQDPIRWVVEDEKGLIAGTKGGEYFARAAADGSAMSALNFPSARRSTKHGSANVEPVEAGKAVLFTQTAKRKIRELAYVYEVDGFRAPDMTLLADHATKGNVAQMVYQQEPFSIIWTRLENGLLWGFTYDRDQDVVGWHRHSLGGYSDVLRTKAPIVESIETMPAPDGSQDDLWITVQRTINGVTKRYVEYLAPFNMDYDTVTDCYFVDGGMTLTYGVNTSVITGLGHLEGETVSLLVDGSPQPDRVVQSGQITLQRGGKIVHVGLAYSTRFQTLRIEAGAANGTAQGKTKRIHKLTVRFHQSVGVWAGRAFDTVGVPFDATDFRTGNHKMGTAVDLFTGDMKLNFSDDNNLDGYMCFEQRQPLPLTILAIMPQLNTQDNQ